jgi:hypothetical protein
MDNRNGVGVDFRRTPATGYAERLGSAATFVVVVRLAALAPLGWPAICTGSINWASWNFIDSVMARDVAKLNCEIEVGYRSSILPQLANLSYRLGRELRWDAHKDQFAGDAEANRMLRREDRKGYEVPKIA